MSYRTQVDWELAGWQAFFDDLGDDTEQVRARVLAMLDPRDTRRRDAVMAADRDRLQRMERWLERGKQ